MHVDENEEYISDLLSDLDKHFFFKQSLSQISTLQGS